MTTTITTAPETKPSIKRALISLALDANSFIRDQLLTWKGDDYARIGAEPVLEVPQSGHCWTVLGRHGRTMVSRTLPIWDVDAVNVEEADEILEGRFRTILEKAAPDDLFRVYRTYKGIRVICTSRVINDLDRNPDRKWFYDLSREMNADHIYMGLCFRQRTFRARLDPKKSRMKGMGTPANARACRLIGEDIGNGTADPALMAQVEFHDEASMALFEHDRELF